MADRDHLGVSASPAAPVVPPTTKDPPGLGRNAFQLSGLKLLIETGEPLATAGRLGASIGQIA